MRIRVALFLAALIVAANAVTAAHAAEFEIDAGRSELVVRLSKEGFAAAIAHNHAIRAAEYTGGAKFDKDNPEAASIWIEVQTASLRADEPGTRERYGLTKEISEKDRQKIQATMLSAEQMDSGKYPTMEFRSTSVEEQSDQKYQITGDLTIHGETRSITFPVTVEEERGSLRGSAEINFKQSDFGIQPYSAMLGAVRNKDDAVLYAMIVLVPVVAEGKDSDVPASSGALHK